MRLADCSFLTYRQFRNRKLRTFLTMFAIGIGIGAMYVLVSFVYGVQELITHRIAPLETLLTIDILPGKLQKLNDVGLEKIKNIPGIVDVVPVISATGQARLNTDNVWADLTLNGASPKYITYEGLHIINGQSYREGEPEAIITLAALSLFPEGAGIIGKEVTVNTLVQVTDKASDIKSYQIPEKIKIVGVVDDRETTVMYLNFVALNQFFEGRDYSLVKVQADHPENMITVKDRIAANGFEAEAVFETVEETSKLFGYVRVSFVFLGLIGLFVASIGMFNTLTISLLERTRDIGFMKAFGASKSDMIKLFLTESLLIGLGGGVFGVAIGLFVCKVVNSVINYIATSASAPSLQLFYSPAWFTITILAFSAILGLITGLYPAKRAANISALEAIRYE